MIDEIQVGHVDLIPSSSDLVEPSFPALIEVSSDGGIIVPGDVESLVTDGLAMEESMSSLGEPITEIPIPTPEPRPFLTTSFEDYTVLEGYMLVFLLCVFVAGLYQLVRRFI